MNGTKPADAERYDLVITNLETQEIKQRPNLDQPRLGGEAGKRSPLFLEGDLQKCGEETTASESYKFYVAGEPGSNNVPFPASLIAPASGTMVSPVDGKVHLNGKLPTQIQMEMPSPIHCLLDTVDGDQDPPEEWKGLTVNSIDIEVDPNSMYYWHVETSDGKNTAISNTYTFRTGENTSSIEGKVVSTSQEILDAIAAAVPGENIYIHGGEYVFDSTIKINTSGSASNMISLLAHPQR